MLYNKNLSAQVTNCTLQIFSFPAQHVPSNDTATSPHQGDTAKVQLPSQVFGSFSHQHKALGIGHYLRGIQGLQNKNNRHLNDLYQYLYMKVSVLWIGLKYSPIQWYYLNPGLSKELETFNVYYIVQLYYPLTYLMSFTNCFLSPSYLVFLGPGICLLASILSPWSEDRHLANTASADIYINIFKII